MAKIREDKQNIYIEDYIITKQKKDAKKIQYSITAIEPA